MRINNTKDIKKNNPNKKIIYSCGSQRLSHEIRSQLNILPINTYTHRVTGKIINEFILTSELSEFLKKWTENRPKKEMTKNGK